MDAVTAAPAVRARRVTLLGRIFTRLWCREKWLFTLIGGSVALAGHGLLKLLITIGCAAGVANAVQAQQTTQLQAADRIR